jgi:yecA family protein
MWQAYEDWRSQDPTKRPEPSVVDGFLAGAAISLNTSTDRQWIETIIGSAASHIDQGAFDELATRLTTIRRELSETDTAYAPVLRVTDEGDFDVSAWVSGFLEAVGADLEVWVLVLANTREGGLLGLLGSHAVGPIGAAARTKITNDPDSSALESVRAVVWELIPALMAFLYRKKLELAAISN